MERIQTTTKNKKMIWVDGNTLVKAVGEQEANEYLHGTGYQSKLTAFIKERDRKVKEEEMARLSKTKKKVVQEVEPSL